MASRTINAAGNYDLGDSGTGSVTTKVVQMTNSALTGSSIAVQGRLIGTSAAFLPISYKRRNLAGVVSDDTTVSAAITAGALIAIDSAGLEVRLAVTGYTSGTMLVEWSDLAG